VTICNENNYSKRRAKHFGLTEQLLNWIAMASNSSNGSYDTVLRYNGSEIDLKTLEVLLSQPIDEAVLQVKFGKDPFSISNITRIKTNLGICFTFNAGEANFSSVRPGSQYGLELLLFVDQDDYLSNETPAAGFRMLLHEPKDEPLMNEYAFHVGPGVYTTVAVSLEKTTQPPSPFSDCDDNPKYSSINCLRNCEDDAVIEACNCSPIGRASVRTCKSVLDLYCIGNVYINISKLSMEDYNVCTCPTQCESLVYKYILSQTKVSDIYAKNISDTYNWTIEQQSKDVVQVNIFYSSFSYNAISFPGSYNFFALLSDVGGALGLLTGATILSLYEVGEFAYDLIRDVIRKRKKQSQQPIELVS
jgi:hypothetical protein